MAAGATAEPAGGDFGFVRGCRHRRHTNQALSIARQIEFMFSSWMQSGLVWRVARDGSGVRRRLAVALGQVWRVRTASEWGDERGTAEPPQQLAASCWVGVKPRW